MWGDFLPNLQTLSALDVPQISFRKHQVTSQQDLTNTVHNSGSYKFNNSTQSNFTMSKRWTWDV